MDVLKFPCESLSSTDDEKTTTDRSDMPPLNTSFAKPRSVGPFEVTFDSALPFGIPDSMLNQLDRNNGQQRKQLAGFEPDCCLAIRSSRVHDPRLAEAKEEVGRLMPGQ